jgi:hypothetical protein
MAHRFAADSERLECRLCGWRFGSRLELFMHRVKTLGRW